MKTRIDLGCFSIRVIKKTVDLLFSFIALSDQINDYLQSYILYGWMDYVWTGKLHELMR